VNPVVHLHRGQHVVVALLVNHIRRAAHRRVGRLARQQAHLLRRGILLHRHVVIRILHAGRHRQVRNRHELILRIRLLAARDERLVKLDLPNQVGVLPRQRIRRNLIPLRSRVLIPAARPEDAILRRIAQVGNRAALHILVQLVESARRCDRVAREISVVVPALAVLVAVEVLMIRVGIGIRLQFQSPALAPVMRVGHNLKIRRHVVVIELVIQAIQAAILVVAVRLQQKVVPMLGNLEAVCVAVRRIRIHNHHCADRRQVAAV